MATEWAHPHTPEETASWWPEPFQLTRAEDRERLRAAEATGRVRRRRDTLARQLEELVRERHPAQRLDKAELRALVTAHLGDVEPDRYGTWFLYPWSGDLVHLLPAHEYRWLRTRRNRYKLTEDEQERLGHARVGVVGLSVGRSAALAMAMEGIGGELRLADPDTLDLSNLNRLGASVADLGLNKTVLAARALAGIDPYLRVVPFAVGLDEANLDRFLIDGGRLDLVVEECDDLAMKLRVRERARALGIPVVMDTSDRGLLDVERFDQEPGRPLLHGLVGDLDARTLAGLSAADRVPVVLRMVGGESVSARAAASMAEIDQTIRSWPQLAEDVALGGAVATAAARQVLLGEGLRSGRYYVDLDEIFGRPLLTRPVRPPPEVEPTPLQGPPPSLRRGGAHLGPAEIRAIVGHGVMAPSAHNAQPWRFRWRGGRLECHRDPERCMTQLDFAHGATWLAIGAAVENITLAAAEAGFAVAVDPFPPGAEPTLAAVLEFHFAPARVEQSPLYAAVARRCTNRRQGTRVALAPEQLEALVRAARPHGEVLLATEPCDLDRLAPLVGESDRLTFLNQAIHAEIMHGLRWSKEEAEAARDGLDLRTMEFDAAERAAMRLLARWSTMAVIKAIGGGRVLENGRHAVQTASAVALVHAPGTSPASYLAGGRAMQRLWLQAELSGIAVVPLATLPFLFARLERGGGQGLGEDEQARLRRWRVEFDGVFATPPGHAEVMMLKLARAGPPSVRSLRRPVDDVLTIE